MNKCFIDLSLKIKSVIFNFTILLALTLPTTSFSSELTSQEEVISYGAKTYYRFCSVCHGEDAKGNGPFSENINVNPPDLTMLSHNNEFSFPWVQLYEVIDGKSDIKAHGSKEMPIWGELFDLNRWSSSNIENANTIVHGRIFELLMYLNSIQVEKE